MHSGAGEETTIGVVGGDDVVRRITAVARESGNAAWRIVASVYSDETEAPRLAEKLAPRVDVCLFGGPFPHDVSVAAGSLAVPATFVPVGGAALYAAMLRGVTQQIFDIERITIDSVPRSDVSQAYEEVGISPRSVLAMPYDSPASAKRFFEFHLENYSSGTSTGAITSVPSVAASLADAGVPTLKMRPTTQTVRTALRTAALMGSGAKLEESRIVMTIVRVPNRLAPAQASPSNYWYQDLRLAVQRTLLHEARSMDAAVLPRDEHNFLVTTTMGSLAAATEGLAVAPFLGRVAAELNIELEVGIGLGRSAREAEANAQHAVDKASATHASAAYLVGPHATVMRLPAERHAEPGPVALSPSRGDKAVEALRMLASGIDREEPVVDALRVAELLGVTLRTARRTLNKLVDDGLAWPMPPARSNKAGRPPRLYQLLVEKLPAA